MHSEMSRSTIEMKWHSLSIGHFLAISMLYTGFLQSLDKYGKCWSFSCLEKSGNVFFLSVRVITEKENNFSDLIFLYVLS